MRAPKRAKKRDANEASIVKALESVGATVLRLDEIDLLVGYGGTKNILMEVKNPEYPNSHKARRERQHAGATRRHRCMRRAD